MKSKFSLSVYRVLINLQWTFWWRAWYIFQLPCYELIFVWNGFQVVGKKYQHCDKVYAVVEERLKRLEAEKKRKTIFHQSMNLFSLFVDIPNLKFHLSMDVSFSLGQVFRRRLLPPPNPERNVPKVDEQSAGGWGVFPNRDRQGIHYSYGCKSQKCFQSI